VFDSSDKIKEIWFLRQLSHDELESKMKEKPSQKSYDWSKFKGSSEDPSEERSKQHDKAANAFNDIWRTGDPSSAKDIMTDDVTIYDPVLGHETKGRSEFENMINGFSKSWQTKKNESSVAVSAGDKAFIWWLNSGSSKDSGEEDTLYGLNMLVFNDEGKITDAISFRQPTKGESHKLLKDPVKKQGA
jgi:ketosteroid isomerase-like protein